MFSFSKLFIIDIPIIFSPGEVLIEVKNVGICGSDVHYWTHGRGARYFLTSTLSELTRESNTVCLGFFPRDSLATVVALRGHALGGSLRCARVP